MKRILIGVVLLIFVLSLTGCDNQDIIDESNYDATYVEFKNSSEVLAREYYYEITSVSELEQFLKNHLGKENTLKKYDKKFFRNNVLLAFMVEESSGGNAHNIYTSDISDSGTLYLDVKLTQGGITMNMAYWAVFYEISQEDFGKITNGINISKGGKVIKLKSYDKTTTRLPEEMPEDFVFSIACYTDEKLIFSTSKNKLVYNEKETEFVISKEGLSEIYQIVREIEIDKLPYAINAKNDPYEEIIIYVKVNGVAESISIWGEDLIDFEWKSFRELGKTIEELINNYIKNTEEFKKIAGSSDE
ncbi:MAG: hypothetical protein IJX78_08000 [Bacilli bacterium]|nr:hypothetical protein [Bacilli bacterium]